MTDFLLKNKEGERMAIRVNEYMPAQGVLILLDREERKGPFLIDTEKKYPIVSLRQPPELCGINESVFELSERSKWIEPFRKKFCSSLAEAVQESGIDTLVIASGGVPWEESPYASCVVDVVIEEVGTDV